MQDLTDILLLHAEQMDRQFVQGAFDARTWSHGGNRGHTGRAISARRRMANSLWDDVRQEWDLSRCSPPLLTKGDHNLKLNKATVYTTGLTLFQYVQRIGDLTVNACPNAGQCAAVCVLNEGKGRFVKVQVSRRAKTAFLVAQPAAFSYLLGWELAMVEIDHIEFLFRPNVASDVSWERLIPAMTGGECIAGMTSYGYTKRPGVLDTDGWLDKAYRVAYSWNEKSDRHKVGKFLDRGGSVAIVTSRKKGAPVMANDPDPLGTYGVKIIDADKTDEWIFERAVIGDLSAKGKARRLIGKNGFVVSVNITSKGKAA